MPTDTTSPPRFTRDEVSQVERDTLAPGDAVHRHLGDEKFTQFTADREVLHAAVRRLVQARQSAGLTLEQVAERTGYRVGRLEALEAMAGLNPDWLLLAGYARAVDCRLTLTASPVGS